MELTEKFIAQAKSQPLKIVYPEGDDERIVIAAARVKEAGIAEPVILGKRDTVAALAAGHKVSIDGIEIIDPATSADLDAYAEGYAASRDTKLGIAKKLVKKPLSFGGMMVKQGVADGMVAGVASPTASVIQSAALTIGFLPGLSTPSSFFIMIIPEFEGEQDKPFIFADCAVNVQPDAKQLAEIAIASGTSAQALLGIEPRIAFLSFSTRGSASHADADKVVEALATAKAIKPEWHMDGEMQGDAAIVMRVGEKKAKGSSVAGQANVLIFPDLDAGNICYKLVQYLAHAKALGPVMQGFASPVNDMSRGASVDDIVDVSAITVVQAQEFKRLLR